MRLRTMGDNAQRLYAARERALAPTRPRDERAAVASIKTLMASLGEALPPGVALSIGPCNRSATAKRAVRMLKTLPAHFREVVLLDVRAHSLDPGYFGGVGEHVEALSMSLGQTGAFRYGADFGSGVWLVGQWVMR